MNLIATPRRLSPADFRLDRVGHATCLTAEHNALTNQARQEVFELGQMHPELALEFSPHGRNIKSAAYGHDLDPCFSLD